MTKKEDPARRYFDRKMTDAERACFEAGIAISTLYHSLIGLPVRDDRKQLELIEHAFARSIVNQPFKDCVKVRISPKGLDAKKGEYGYGEITGEWLELEVVASYGSATAVARMSYIGELGYPLMYIARISKKKEVS